MSRSVNKVVLVGRLGQDPKLKYTKGGAAVCTFSIATNSAYTNAEGERVGTTEWHRIVVWGRLAEVCNEYLCKGQQAYVEGSLQTRSWETREGVKKYRTEVKAREVIFLGGRRPARTSRSASARPAVHEPDPASRYGSSEKAAAPAEPDADLPF